MWLLLLLLGAWPARGSDLGFSVGSRAASELARHVVHSALQQPRRFQLDLKNAEQPGFEPLARVGVKARLQLNRLQVRFTDGFAEVSVHNLSLHSVSDVAVLPLPFFLGEDSAHLDAEVGVRDGLVRFRCRRRTRASRSRT